MRVLVIGGTQFVGRHIVSSLIADGDMVTLFHRGETNPDLFAWAEHRLGDRNVDLSALASGSWDVTIDTSAYVPRQVRTLAEALDGRGGRYVQISTVSVYDNPQGAGTTEHSLLAVLDDPTTEVVSGHTYGGLKALCEQEALQSFGPTGADVSIVRPTYVAGPYDYTGRFTWWVERVARGGRVLAPGPQDNSFQVIDARDLADFVALLAHGQATGTFHAVSPRPPFSWEGFLTTAVDAVGPAGTELVWVDAQALEDAGVTPAELPLWAGLAPGRDINALDPSAALAAGLAPRPLAQTVVDTHDHEQAEPTPVRGPIGLEPAREEELLRLAV
jgi:2'-hydroxyisoflavone reductase